MPTLHINNIVRGEETGSERIYAGDVLKALGITDYDTTDENGNVTTDTAAFARDVDLAAKHQRDKARRAAEKDAAKRLATLVRS